jgi:hypothetical protein
MPRIDSFEVVRLNEGDRPVILIYALGEDGVLYEMSGGRWISLPITDKVLTLEEVQAQQREAQAQAPPEPPSRRARIIKPNNGGRV